MAPENLIDLMNTISMDNMTKGESELQHVSHGRHELVLHFTHSENFSTDALQEAFEAHEEFVQYTFINDPDEQDSFCSELICTYKFMPQIKSRISQKITGP